MNGLEIRTPATIFDMADLGGARTAMHWAVLKEMHQNGLTWFVSFDGAPLGLFGIYPESQELAEAWFNVQPNAGLHLLRLVRAMRLTLNSLHYREIVTICGTPEGGRVAKAIGFSPSGFCKIGEIWKWTHLQAEADDAQRSSKPNSSSAAV